MRLQHDQAMFVIAVIQPKSAYAALKTGKVFEAREPIFVCLVRDFSSLDAKAQQT